jgi:hypothetical protein
MLKGPFVPLVYSNPDDRQAPTSRSKFVLRLIVLLPLPCLGPASPGLLSNLYQDFSTNVRAEQKGLVPRRQELRLEGPRSSYQPKSSGQAHRQK